MRQAHYTDYPGVWGGLSSMRRGDASHFYLFDPQSNARNLDTVAPGVVVGTPGNVLVRTGGTSGYVVADAVRRLPVANSYRHVATPSANTWLAVIRI